MASLCSVCLNPVASAGAWWEGCDGLSVQRVLGHCVEPWRPVRQLQWSLRSMHAWTCMIRMHDCLSCLLAAPLPLYPAGLITSHQILLKPGGHLPRFQGHKLKLIAHGAPLQAEAMPAGGFWHAGPEVAMRHPNQLNSAPPPILKHEIWELPAGAVGCYLAGLACIGIVYHYYAPHASCGLNLFFITWTLVWGMLFTGLSVRHSLHAVPCLRT